MTGFDASDRILPVVENKKLSFIDAGVTHYTILAFMVLIPLFILITLIAEFRTKMPKKWLWIIFTLLGFSCLSFNWETGHLSFNLLHINVLGVGMLKAGGGPWIFSLGFPLGAFLFWPYRKEIIEKRKNTEAKDV